MRRLRDLPWRVLRNRFVRVLIAVAPLLAALSWGMSGAVVRRLDRIGALIDGELTVGSVDVSPLLGSVEVVDLEVRRHGEVLFSCPRLEIPLRVSLRNLSVDAAEAVFTGPRLTVRRKPDGRLNVDGVFLSRPGEPMPPLPPILVTSGTVDVDDARSFPAPLHLTDLQLTVAVQGEAFVCELLARPAWRQEPPFCREAAVRGRLTGLDNLQAAFRLADVRGAALPPGWLGGARFTGGLDVKGRFERWRGTTVVEGDLATDELSILPSGAHAGNYQVLFLGYRGTFTLQEGRTPLRPSPPLPAGGGTALELTTAEGSLRVLFPRAHKSLHLPGAALVLQHGSDRLVVRELSSRLLGTRATARGTVDFGGEVPRVAASFALPALDGAQLSAALPFARLSLAGTVAVTGTVVGPLTAPSVNVEARADDARISYAGEGGRTVAVHLADGLGLAAWDGRTLVVDQLSGRLEQGARAHLSGRWTPRVTDSLAVEAALEHAAPELVARLLGRPEALDLSPARPAGPMDLVASLRPGPAGPRLGLTLTSTATSFDVDGTTVPVARFVASAALDLPRTGLPAALPVTAAAAFPDGGSLYAGGTVPLNAEAPLDVRLSARGLDAWLLARVAAVPGVTARGRFDVEATLGGRGRVDALSASFRMPGTGTLELPRHLLGSDAGDDEEPAGGTPPATGTLGIDLDQARGGLHVVRTGDGVAAQLVSASSRLPRGGTLSLSAQAARTSTGTSAQATFACSDVEPGELLGFLGVGPAVDAVGRGSLEGRVAWSQVDTDARASFRFPTSTLVLTTGGRGYRLPVNAVTGELEYEKRGARERFVVPGLSAVLLRGGKLQASGSNDSTPPAKPNVRFTLDGIETKDLVDVLRLKDFSARGRLRVEGVIAGSLWRPRLSGVARTDGVRLFLKAPGGDKYVVQTGRGRATLRLQRDRAGFVLKVDEAHVAVLEGALSARGTVRLTPEPRVDLALTLREAEAKRLAEVLAVPDLSFAGALDATGRLSGPAGASTLDAAFAMRDARLFYKLGRFNLFYQPPRVGGRLIVDPDSLRLQEVRGVIHGGSFLFDVHRFTRKEVHWNASLKFLAVDLHKLFLANLKQANDIGGLGYLDLFVTGKGATPGAFAGQGTFRVEGGAIRDLEELRRLQQTYKLRNLLGIQFEEVRSKVVLIAERLRFTDARIRSSKGNVRGQVAVGFDGTLDGAFRASLDRDVLSTGHRLLAALEGGRRFDFGTRLAGTTDAPQWRFSMPGIQRGALLTGAVLFSPLAPAAVIVTGLKSLFGSKHRPRSAGPEAAAATPALTQPPTPAPSPAPSSAPRGGPPAPSFANPHR